MLLLLYNVAVITLLHYITWMLHCLLDVVGNELAWFFLQILELVIVYWVVSYSIKLLLCGT